MTPHPSSTRLLLAAVGADSSAAKHVEACGRCRHIVDTTAHGPLPTPPIDVGISAPLRDLLRQLLPDRALAIEDIWRAEWDGQAELAVVLARPTDDQVAVAAVDTVDPDASGTFRTETVAEEGLAGAVAILPNPSVVLPRYALDRRVGRVADMPSPGEKRPPWELRAAHRRLRRLAADAAAAMSAPPVTSTVGEWLRSKGVTRQDLRAGGLSGRSASLILQDRQPPTSAQIDVIARLIDVPRQEVEDQAGRPDGSLVVLLHAPQNRPRVAERAADDARPVPAVRRESALAIATTARRTARGTDIDWQREIDAYFSR